MKSNKGCSDHRCLVEMDTTVPDLHKKISLSWPINEANEGNPKKMQLFGVIFTVCLQKVGKFQRPFKSVVIA